MRRTADLESLLNTRECNFKLKSYSSLVGYNPDLQIRQNVLLLSIWPLVTPRVLSQE